MNFPSMLIDSSYALAEKISIFMKPGYAGIAYSDGDETENRIANIIAEAQDLSIFSRELAVQCTDWPSLYHLSGTRANILRPFHSILKQANVLEIGAGCGAITRYLGESGANVLALEGSPRRAAIARSRTRDLENVTVVADKFDQFQCDLRFDIITLIGVLEYAPLFTDGENPVVSMLTRVRELLKPEGRLILAIENQLGLKYFAGAAEDHTGEPMLGIEGRYSTKGPQTFGRKVLTKMLQQAGFVNQQFMAPFPDYKLPVSIITEQGLNCDTFDAAALCWQSVHRDPQLRLPLVFAPELAWPIIEANSLTLDLANSFLVSASVSNDMPLGNSIMAYHYSTSGRHAAFCKESLFVLDANNILVKYNLLNSNDTKNTVEKLVRFNIPKESLYIKGEVLHLELIRIVTRDGWHIDEVGRFLKKYIEIIKIFAKENNYIINHISVDTNVPGSCFDIVPQNIILSDHGKFYIIDQEWTLNKDIKIGWLIFRTLFLLINSISRFSSQKNGVIYSRMEFIVSAFHNAGLTTNKKQIKKFWFREINVQAEIHGYESTDPFEWDLELPLNYHIQHESLKEKEEKLKNIQLDLNNTKIDLNNTKIDLNNTYIHINNLEKTVNYYKVKNLQTPYELQINKKRLITNVLKHQRDGAVSWLEKGFLKQDNTQRMLNRIGNFLRRNNKNNRQQLKQLKKLNERLGLVDYSFYVNSDTALKESKIDPVWHYFYFGAAEGRNPSPYFYTKWYLAEYPDVVESGINPLLHYLMYGLKEARNPNPYFYTKWYYETYLKAEYSEEHPLRHYLDNYREGIVKPNPYFDTLWYSNTYLTSVDTPSEPFAHFLQQTSEIQTNPNPYFDAEFYQSTYPWVKKMDMHPLQHYIYFSTVEKTEPNAYFDSNWYKNQYAEILDEESDPFAHYLTHIKTGDYNPNPYFDADWYRTTYPDVIETGVDPLLHYILHGADEHRNPGPYFDTSYYLNKYPDVKESGMNPLLHFLEFGSFECRDPYPEFDTNWYLTQYPETLETGLPPLLHYIQKGREEGKLTRDPDGIIDNKNFEYALWRERFFALTDVDKIVMQDHIEDFAYTPLLSVLMPVYNPPANFLIEAIESVRNQIYSNWELCIADDASTDPQIHEILIEYSKLDSRIKVIFREENGHISKASNSALELVSGDFVALLDHDDLLTEDALFWVTECLQKHTEADLIYSDEDKIDEAGILQEPYFKPDWDPFLFLGQNFFSHLGVYRTSLLKQVGGFRVGFEGSQDYDLVARCIEKASSKNIIHIPRILYHWRILEGSAALDPSEKPYAQIAAEKTVREHLKRRNIDAEVVANPITGQEIVFHSKDSLPFVSIIIPTRNNIHLIKNCIDSIINNTINIFYEIIIIDNGSDDAETLAYLETLTSDERIQILEDTAPFNFSRLNNRAAERARGDILILLNNDTEVINPEWLEELVQLALLPGVGAVGAKLYYSNNSIQHAGVILGLGGCAGHIYQGEPAHSNGYFANLYLLRGYTAVTAACLAIKTSIYKEVAGLDEVSLAVGYNDVDFCLKLRAHGYRNLWTPKAMLFHHESVSRGKEDTPEKKKRFWNEISLLKKRWPNSFYHDPAYNPNLTLNRANYSLSEIPRTVLNARNWPLPFKPSYSAPKASGLRLLVIINGNSYMQENKFLKLVKQLHKIGEIDSYALASPEKFLEISDNASGWFDVICLNNFPLITYWFEHYILKYITYILSISDSNTLLTLSEKNENKTYQTIIHANKLIFTEAITKKIIENNYGLDLPDPSAIFLNLLAHDKEQIFLNILKSIQLEKPIPACCLIPR